MDHIRAKDSLKYFYFGVRVAAIIIHDWDVWLFVQFNRIFQSWAQYFILKKTDSDGSIRYYFY